MDTPVGLMLNLHVVLGDLRDAMFKLAHSVELGFCTINSQMAVAILASTGILQLPKILSDS